MANSNFESRFCLLTCLNHITSNYKGQNLSTFLSGSGSHVLGYYLYYLIVWLLVGWWNDHLVSSYVKWGWSYVENIVVRSK